MTKKKIFLSVIVVFIFSLLFYLNYFFKTEDENYVIKINNKKITKEEYLLYFYEQKQSFENAGGVEIWDVDFDGVTAVNVAKQNAFESIKLVKISSEEAVKRNINKVEPIDLEHANELKEKLADEISIEKLEKIGITDKKLLEIMIENVLYQKVYEDVTENVSIVQSDFETFFDKYIEENSKSLKDIMISYVFIKNYDIENGIKIKFDDKKQEEVLKKSLDILKEAKVLNDFETVIKKYSDDSILGEIEKQVTIENFNTEVVEQAYKMSVGDISEIIYTEDGYYIIKVNNIIYKELSKTKELVKDYYIAKQKQKIFDIDYKKWSDGTKIIINKKVWDDISLIDFE